MEITNLPTLGYQPDAVMVGTKVSDMLEGTPLAGVLPPVHQTVVVGREGSKVAVVFHATDLTGAHVLAGELESVEVAEVEFANALDLLRRDGWSMREPDPWELPDPLAPDAPVPF